jgi:hypothetical protein
MSERTIRVTGAHFCAALIVNDGVVVETASILKHYRGLTWKRTMELLHQKHCTWETVVAADAASASDAAAASASDA